MTEVRLEGEIMKDEYPTDEELDRIQNWPLNDIPGGFEFVKSLWHWPGFGIAESDGVLYLATGGWSGNESIVDAMMSNIGMQTRWICSSRGGAHEFELSAKHPHRETRFKLQAQYDALAARLATVERERDAITKKHDELAAIMIANKVQVQSVQRNLDLRRQLAEAQGTVARLEALCQAHDKWHLDHQMDIVLPSERIDKLTQAEQQVARLRASLKNHWVTAVDCDHEAKTDTVRCSCSVWTGTPKPSVGQAIEEWIDHVFEQALRETGA